MNLSKFTYNHRSGAITETATGEAVGTELNGALVTDVDGFLVTNAEIAWRLYHGDIAVHQRVIPINEGLMISINNLRLVDADDVEAKFSLPGYMSVEQTVLEVANAPEDAEISVEEAVEGFEPVEDEPVAEAPVVEFDQVVRQPNGKWRAYALVNGKVESVGEFRKKKDAQRCAEHRAGLESKNNA